MKILVQKFGGTSVDGEERRQMAAGKIIRALQAGWSVVVVVSAIGRAGAPYATDTLVSALKAVDISVPPAAREMDLMMACGEIISTVILAQTLRTRGYDTIALTGAQAGILTDYEFGNARILSIDPTYMVRMLEQNKIVLVAGFQGATVHGAITTLGRGGSDTTASALGAALKPHASEIACEIYTDVDGVKTADPRQVPNARTLATATYEEVAEMAHLGAKVVHPRAAEIAHQYDIALWVKSTLSDELGTLITSDEHLGETEQARRVTGVTHTGKIAYLRFELPSGSEEDKGRIELEIYRLLQREAIPLYLNNTGGAAFSFAIGREHLGRLRDLLDGLVIPVVREEKTRRAALPPPVYLIGMGVKQSGFAAQRTMLEKAARFVRLYTIEADVTENCAVVSVIAAGRFRGVPGVMVKVLKTLSANSVPVYQTADSDFSVSVLIPEADIQKATRALHDVFSLGNSASAVTTAKAT